MACSELPGGATDYPTLVTFKLYIFNQARLSNFLNKIKPLISELAIRSNLKLSHNRKAAGLWFHMILFISRAFNTSNDRPFPFSRLGVYRDTVLTGFEAMRNNDSTRFMPSVSISRYFLK